MRGMWPWHNYIFGIAFGEFYGWLTQVLTCNIQIFLSCHLALDSSHPVVEWRLKLCQRRSSGDRKPIYFTQGTHIDSLCRPEEARLLASSCLYQGSTWQIVAFSHLSTAAAAATFCHQIDFICIKLQLLWYCGIGMSENKSGQLFPL